MRGWMPIPGGWLVAWGVVTIINLAGYGLRKHTGLPLYLEVAENYLHGRKIYLRPGIESEFDRFTYPPSMAVLAIPMVPLPDLLQRIAWCGFNAGLLVLSIYLLHRAVVPLLRRIAERRTAKFGTMTGIFWLVVGLIMMRHLLSPLENQSHDLIILALLTIGTCAAIRRADWITGGAWGTAAALKLTPLLLLPLLVVQGRYRTLAVMIGAFTLISITPDLVNPNTTGQSHLEQYYEVIGTAARPGTSGGEGQWNKWNHLNQNLSGTIYRLTAPTRGDYQYHEEFRQWFPVLSMSDSGRRMLTLLLQGILVCLVAMAGWWTRRSPGERAENGLRELAAVGVVASMMLLLSPMSSKSHFVILLIPAAAVVLHMIGSRNDWFGLGVVIATILLCSFNGKSVIGHLNSEWLLIWGSHAACALMLGIGSLRICWLLRAQPTSAEDGSIRADAD
ncbi:MAG: glycosyltransferase family 87 protein [Planctomycetota bacterium]|nr:glycosyltransferase family 87 protein [Planctomycetota bacterium]